MKEYSTVGRPVELMIGTLDPKIAPPGTILRIAEWTLYHMLMKTEPTRDGSGMFLFVHEEGTHWRWAS